MSRPVYLFSPGLPWCILMASLILLLDTWSSLSNILASFRLHLWPVSSRCSPTAVLGCRPAVCSLYLVPRLLLVSPMYILSQLSHFRRMSHQKSFLSCFHLSLMTMYLPTSVAMVVKQIFKAHGLLVSCLQSASRQSISRNI